MLEMPSIESDFPVFGGVDFNLLYTSNNPVKATNITGYKEIGMFLQSMVFLDIKDEPTD